MAGSRSLGSKWRRHHSVLLLLSKLHRNYCIRTGQNCISGKIKFLHVPKGNSRNSLSCVAQEDLRKRWFILWYPRVDLGSVGCGGLASGWSEFGLFTVQPALDKDI